MGCKELINSLRAAGDEKLKALRCEAEQEAERVRAEAVRRVEALREEHGRKHAATAAQHADIILSEAHAAVRAIALRTERTLADRLYAAAQASLRSLRNTGYRDVFIGFCRELPRFTWKSVRVHPDDVELAREQFRDAEIHGDPCIIGGMVAVSEGDRVVVVNTFEKRLECLWEEMLPEIMQEAAGKRP